MTTTTPTPTIEGKLLLTKLKPWVGALVDDMRAHYADDPALNEAHAQATKAKRTAEAYTVWLDAELTQAAVAWILAGVFIRLLEDQQLIEPRLTGVGDRHARAVEAERRYFEAHPTASFTDFWLSVFKEMQGYRATGMLYDEAHTPLWRLRPSGDQAKTLLSFWRTRDDAGDAPALRFDADRRDTRFLGDLYQDLSEAARKRYALLQTPDFVEEFILDRTLEPAILVYGLARTTLIDPTCGSGHFLLGAFERLVGHWQSAAPGEPVREHVLKALASITGVDLNPFAVAISRFRLVVAALRAESLTRLADAPAYELNVAVGDTLLHAPSSKAIALPYVFHTAGEDAALLERIFERRYTVVVGNPPYISVKDKALNQAYRERYPDSCYREYSLGVPFTEVFFRLASPSDDSNRAGFVGMITADSFMKREFGKQLIEVVLPKFDLTHVISTAGAYIPGHGTPTVILLGRNRRPSTSTVRVVMGIRGEPEVPAYPSLGLVWTAILNQVDVVGSLSSFISVDDLEREGLGKHPWSLGGGGASALKSIIEDAATRKLGDIAGSIGFMCITKADEIFTTKRKDDPVFVSGEAVRDWNISSSEHLFFPYDESGELKDEIEADRVREFFPFRAVLESRAVFGGQSFKEAGKRWWEFGQIPRARLKIPFSITYAFIATHNHFVFDRGGKVFNRSAPLIKLRPESTETDYLGLLGLLNSSVACFWMKQLCFVKGGISTGTVIQSESWSRRLEFDGSKLQGFPIVDAYRDRTTELARRIELLAEEYQRALPEVVVRDHRKSDLGSQLVDSATLATEIRRRLVALQEELDWTCYVAYGLIECDDLLLDIDALEPLSSECRPFAIRMAREHLSGEKPTHWFDAMEVKPARDFPTDIDPKYRSVLERRLSVIETDPNISIIESADYKRKWEPIGLIDARQQALKNWILDRLESTRYWDETQHFRSIRELAVAAASDEEMQQAVDLYTGQTGADLYDVLAPLIGAESVPFLSGMRLTASGVRKRHAWEATWELQRREDAGMDVGIVPAPPRYSSDDFRDKEVWRLRGALDVPKERFISLPGLERLPDTSLVIGWAGWNHLEKAQAIAGYYMWAKEQEAWPKERLVPLLAGIVEELPWLFQWHNDLVDGSRPAEDVAIFVDHELAELGMTREDALAWTPAAPTGRKPGRKAKG
ncbi:MAG TPA: BREX-2 system adenine-specific DNA-methyltransferase PglX [Oscillatoriaceae cyanobacterium]